MSVVQTVLLLVVIVLLALSAFGVRAPRSVAWFPLAMMVWCIKALAAGYGV